MRSEGEGEHTGINEVGVMKRMELSQMNAAGKKKFTLQKV